MALRCAEEVQLDIRKKFFSGVVRYWNRLPWKIVESPSLEVLKKKIDV